MTDEQRNEDQPRHRMYSEGEVENLVHESVIYGIKAYLISRSNHPDADELEDAISYRQSEPFGREADIACKTFDGISKDMINRLKAKGIDTTHLE